MKKLASLTPLAALFAVSLAPAIAQADGPAESTASTPFAPPFTGALPQGIRMRADGVYVQDVCDHSLRYHCYSHRVLPPSYVPGGAIPVLPDATSPPAGGLSPKDILSLYNIPSTTSGNGRVVAIVDSPDKNAFKDLNGYRAGYNIPALPRCANNKPTGTLPACFAQVNYDGNASTGQDSGQGDIETSLDMDMISAACPDCSILLVEIPPLQNVTNQDFITAAKTAASLGAKATSYSLGGPESTDPKCAQPNNTDLTGYTTPGHLVLAASGDFGYLQQNFPQNNGGPCSSPSYPSTAPDVVSVGGTTVTGTIGTFAEKVWNDGQGGQDSTTSGCSTEFPMPSWQTSLLSGSGCSKRASADLSAVAAFNPNGLPSSDIVIYDSANAAGFSGGVEGTSAASPLVAAILTRLNLTDQVAASFGFIYQNASKFNDVTSGNDDDTGTCNNLLCKATTGWDAPTGVGTPNGAELATLAPSSGGCTSNTGCSGATPVCDTSSGQCVQCTKNGDCASTTPVCSTTAHTCGPCTSNTDCTDPTKPQCTNGACVAATTSGGDAGSTGGGADDAGGTTGTGTGTGKDAGTRGVDAGAGTGTQDQTDFGGVGSSGCAVGEGRSSSGVALGLVVGLAALAGAKRRRRG